MLENMEKNPGKAALIIVLSLIVIRVFVGLFQTMSMLM